ncbi:ATP-binding protein [Sphingomonas lenta]|uniref:ATP-binding protein n=1 Tax=Sphingomonas lenta TaxID=1141887 RepID=A0A2A2SDS1_9SPHN|nr:ATP-binding protein [Sphingomonas lenta]
MERLLALKPERRAALLRGLSDPQRRELNERWDVWAGDGQRTPDGDWRVWMIRAGRGFGKTRAGAEWISAVARETPDGQLALVGDTLDEVRAVMVEGRSGVMAVARTDERVEWLSGRRAVRFASGAVGYLYAATAPEKLRGPEHHAAWCDEVAKWREGDRTWDNLLMGLRVGERPRVLVTTTPRPNALMRRVLAARGLEETGGRTRDNPHLPVVFVADMEDAYGGTRLGRQELDGELIEDAEGALWRRKMFDDHRVAAAPKLRRVVVGVDPPASVDGDLCGIVGVGLGRDERLYVLEDASVGGSSPEGWAHAVAACASRWGADRVVAEKNQGGDMVRHVLAAAEATLPIKLVHATRGKVARAEPVALRYEAGRVSHAGRFPELEDELCGLRIGGGYDGPGRSPDRADACVWACTALMEGQGKMVGVRQL